MKHKAFGISVLLFCGVVFCATEVQGQTLTINPSIVDFNIVTKSDFINGKTKTVPGQLETSESLTIGLLSSQFVKLEVKANSNTFSSGTNIIPLSVMKLHVDQPKIGSTLALLGDATAPEITLSNQYQTIYNLSQVLNLTLSGKFTTGIKYILDGGNDLLIPAGTYTTQITYQLTAPFLLGILGLLTKTITSTATLNIHINDLSQITVQNAATLTFSTSNNYANGVQTTQTNGLNVFSNQNYQVTVQAATNLKNDSNTINISNVTLKPTANPPASSVNTNTISFSTTDQAIISNGLPTLGQDFDLKYFTQAGNTAFLGKSPGTYTTTLTYTITAM